MSSLLLFQNLCMNRKTDHYFTRRRVFTSGLLIWTLENFHSIYCSAAVQNSLQGFHPKRSHSSPRGKWETPTLTPSFSPGGCWRPCKNSQFHCSQAVPAGCPWVPKPVLTLSQPCGRAPAASLGQSEPTPLLWLGRIWLHPFLTAWCKTLHCHNCSLISGRLI